MNHSQPQRSHPDVALEADGKPAQPAGAKEALKHLGTPASRLTALWRVAADSKHSPAPFCMSTTSRPDSARA